MKNEELLESISTKLNVLISLLLENKKDEKTKDKVKLLRRFKLPNKEIAEIIGTSKNTVEVIASQSKNK